jgi:hypothetical protein
MPHQTSLKSDQRDSPAAGVRSGVSGVLHDALTLAELQFKLLAVDAQAASGRAIVPVALLGSASVFAASALPLLLIALAQLLRDQAGWPPALATLASVGAGIVVAGVLALFGYFGLRTCLAPLGRSRDEFNRNVTWLKTTLKRHEIRREAEQAVTPGSTQHYSTYPR